MNRRRTLLGAAGVAAFACAQLVGADARIESLVPTGALVTAVGNDYLLVGALAGIAVLVGVKTAASGVKRRPTQTEMPTPEYPVAAPTPGEEFDEALRSLRVRLPIVGREIRSEIHERLRETATETITRTMGCTRREAEAHLAVGDWTENPEAARLLRRGSPSPPPSDVGVPILLTGSSRFAWSAARAVDAIVELERDGR